VVQSRPVIVSLRPDSLADIWRDIARVAEALGVTERGLRLVSRLRRRMRAVAERAATAASRPRVACIEWIEPLMAAGNWTPELIEAAGGEGLFGVAGAHAPALAWDALLDSDPDVICVAPCGFDLARSRAEMPALVARPGWRDLRAVREGRVYLGDGNALFNRPGPRVAETLEVLAEILHPEAFRFGHEGGGWIRYSG
jgi:iron complex transport system substrate-binding protein